MTNTRYGVNESRKLFCKKHQEFHPSNERCRWCPVPEVKHVYPATAYDYLYEDIVGFP